jgi:hypothetical protein
MDKVCVLRSCQRVFADVGIAIFVVLLVENEVAMDLLDCCDAGAQNMELMGPYIHLPRLLDDGEDNF